MKCPQHYLTEMQEVILFYNGLEVLTRQILDSKGAIPTKTAADAKVAIQEMVEYSQKWHNRTSRARSIETFDGLAAIQAELNNLGREIKKVNEKERGFGSLPSSTDTNPRDHVKSISTTVEADMTPIRHIGSSQYAELVTVKHLKGIAKNILVGIGKFIFPVDFIILDMPEDVKVPLILEKPNLSTAHAKIDVFKRKITLRVGEEKIIFKSVKPTSSMIKRVYMLSLRERMELDLEARLMEETLVLNRSRDQVDDLMPTIEEGEVVDKPMIEDVKTRDDNKMVSKIFGYPNDYDEDEKMLVEDMDPYLDEGIGEVVVGEPLCKVSCVETRRFDGIITIHDEDESVTYQMVRSIPRFKHHTNEQCNNIPPLLRVSEQDKMNGSSHPYQKLKGFYKGVLNLEPNFIRDPKMEEWLTHGHISVHEME
ncbi:gag-pol polyprotein [Tanacetum coccineum]